MTAVQCSFLSVQFWGALQRAPEPRARGFQSTRATPIPARIASELPLSRGVVMTPIYDSDSLGRERQTFNRIVIMARLKNI